MEFYKFKSGGRSVYINKEMKIVSINDVGEEGSLIYVGDMVSRGYSLDESPEEVMKILNGELPKTAIFKKSIDDLVLTVRSANCLKSDDIYYIDDLIQKTKFHLRNINNLGKKSLREIEEELERHGLSLKA